MTTNAIVQIAIYVVVLLLLVKPLGLYMARVYEGQPIGIDRVLGPVERLFYKLCGVKSDEGMDWKTYALAVILFSLVSGLVVYALQRLQALQGVDHQPAHQAEEDDGQGVGFPVHPLVTLDPAHLVEQPLHGPEHAVNADGLAFVHARHVQTEWLDQ